jgi:hypothetical protein
MKADKLNTYHKPTMKEYIHRDSFLYPQPEIREPIRRDYYYIPEFGYSDDDAFNESGYNSDMAAYNTYKESILPVVGEHSWKNWQKVVEGVDFEIRYKLSEGGIGGYNYWDARILLGGKEPAIVFALPLNTQKQEPERES